jgi:hypothetical protein
MPGIFIRGKSMVVILLVIILIGCTPKEHLPDQSTRTKTPILEQSTISGYSQTTPTVIYKSAIANPIPEQLSTETIAPTNDVQHQRSYILELIRTNANCKFPCFLSITPGISTWETAKNFIISTGAKYSDRTENDGIHHFTGYNTKSLKIPLSIEYLDINGSIEYISGGMGDLNNVSKTGIEWTPYKINSILSIYGVPTKVLLDIYKAAAPSSTTAYELWLIYDDTGFVIKYAGENVAVEDPYRICPNSSDTGDIYGFVAFFKSQNTKWPKDLTEMMSKSIELEKVTDLSIKDFYNKFTGDSDNVCFISNQNKWGE